MRINLLLITTFFLILVACQKDPVIADEVYNCNLSFTDNSSLHPKKIKFENAIKKIEHVVPGLQASVRSVDGNLWTGKLGFSDINSGVEMENCSKFLVGSISKIFTSVLILKLQEEGLLTIDDPIKKWVDQEFIENIENADQVTIKNLLMNNSGIKEYIGVQFQIDRLNNSKLLLTPQEKLQYVYNKPADFAPNEKYGYSNTNYVLLGLIVEKASGMPLEKVVESYISDAIFLKNTTMATSDNPIPSGTSRPYLDLGNGQYQDVMDFALSDAATGDGGIISNSQDLLFFMESIVNTTLISSGSYDQMISNKVEIKTDKWYGLGIELENRDHGFRIAHNGGTEGYLSFLMSYPDSGVSIAVCMNSSSPDEDVLIQIAECLIELQDIAFE